MNKTNLGSVIILIGVAVIGFIWFKKNKPTIADKQLEDIKSKSNNVADKIDIRFSEQGEAKIEKEKIAQKNWELFSVPLNESQKKELQNAGYGQQASNSPYMYDIYTTLKNMDLRNI
jgi:hypothetical protein